MNAMVQSYAEETEDLLQKAEECAIRLEKEYSPADADELFRIAHTIKGSSQVAGFEDIGNVMHKIEDMLDCIRNGSIPFDRSVVSLCLDGLDIVGRMLACKKGQDTLEMMQAYANTASGIGEKIEAFIRSSRKNEEKTEAGQPTEGIVASLINKRPRGKNRYYITFFIGEDAPMVSPVLLMILSSVEGIGSLAYSSITDSYFSGCVDEEEIKTFEIILCTDIEESELYTYFNLFYVERISIINLTREIQKGNDYCLGGSGAASQAVIMRVLARLCGLLSGRHGQFPESGEALRLVESLKLEAAHAFGRMANQDKLGMLVNDFNELFSLAVKSFEEQADDGGRLRSRIHERMTTLIEDFYGHIKGKYLIKVFKPDKNHFTDRLDNFMEMLDRSSTLLMLIDLSRLSILYEDEVRALIRVKKETGAINIETCIIAGGSGARRIENIFDCIRPVEEFDVFGSELDAISGMLRSENFVSRIDEMVKDVKYGQLH